MQRHIELQIGKWGNSLGIRLPKHVLEVLQLREKDKVSCEIEDGKLILDPVRPVRKYSLDELLARVEEPGEEISWGKKEGEEAW
ncbi:MAG: AbrB/MazE/SpoVT family DNA-binding domain-containing protein [Pseudomonadota bacterium]